MSHALAQDHRDLAWVGGTVEEREGSMTSDFFELNVEVGRPPLGLQVPIAGRRKSGFKREARARRGWLDHVLATVAWVAEWTRRIP